MKKYAVLLALAVSLLLVQAAAANLVVNGGFESGKFLPGWTYSATLDYAGVDKFPPDLPHSGIFYGYFGNYNTRDNTTLMGFLSQTIATTPGASYEVSFWLWSYGVPGNISNQFQAKWDGNIIFAQTDIPGDWPVIYTQYQFTEVATGSSTVLEFGLSNVPGWMYMDDISVNQVPIPGAVWLLGSGLVGLAGLRRKFKS